MQQQDNLINIEFINLSESLQAENFELQRQRRFNDKYENYLKKYIL